MSKRRRTGSVVVQRTAKRPIDKCLVAVSQTCSTTQVESSLGIATFPATLVGLRWSLSWASAGSTANPITRWALVIVRDGLAANTIATSDGADFYTPEGDVLAFGVVQLTESDVTAGPQTLNIEGQSKSMRKMKNGDQFVFITLCSLVSGMTVNGVIQFFTKS